MRLLGLILVLAAILRFWGLGQIPPSLTWDEASWGYNAYSLGIDGRDEFGRFLPLSYLESFGDFKPPVYAYLDVLPVKILGLNEFSVRFPSALFGVLTVLFTFFLTRRIFFNSKYRENYATMASLVLALSPWHIMLSRAAFEANVASFFIVLGILLFLKSIQEKENWSLIFSVVSFVLSLYTFNTARVVSPIIFVFLLGLFWKSIWQRRKLMLISFIVGFAMILPTLGFFLSDQSRLRFREVNIFSDPTVIETVNQETQNDKDALWSKVLHNRRFAYGVEFLKHYFDNLNPSFLFIKGDGNPKFSTQDVGELYLWDLSFLIFGAFLLFRKKEGLWFLIPFWLFLGIIPAATARETPHALRIETVLPTFQIIIAYGFINSLSLLGKYKYLKYFFFVVLAFNVIYFLHGYYSHYSKEFSKEWQYGYKDSISYVSSVEDQFGQINITDDLGRPYIYYLFYKKYDPKKFRKTSIIKRDPFGFVTVEGFDKYRFGRDVGKLSRGKSNLFVDLYNRVPKKATKWKTFYLLNGDPALTVYTK